VNIKYLNIFNNLKVLVGMLFKNVG